MNEPLKFTHLEGWIFEGFLAEIRSRWGKIPLDLDGNRWPWGIWIVYFPKLDVDGKPPTGSDSVPDRAWFLDRRGFREMNIWSYARFDAVATGLRVSPESRYHIPNILFGRPYQIGNARFGRLDKPDYWFLSYQFGGLFGEGMKYRADEPTRTLCWNSQLWVS